MTLSDALPVRNLVSFSAASTFNIDIETVTDSLCFFIQHHAEVIKILFLFATAFLLKILYKGIIRDIIPE